MSALCPLARPGLSLSLVSSSCFVVVLLRRTVLLQCRAELHATRFPLPAASREGAGLPARGCPAAGASSTGEDHPLQPSAGPCAFVPAAPPSKDGGGRSEHERAWTGEALQGPSECARSQTLYILYPRGQGLFRAWLAKAGCARLGRHQRSTRQLDMWHPCSFKGQGVHGSSPSSTSRNPSAPKTRTIQSGQHRPYNPTLSDSCSGPSVVAQISPIGATTRP